MKNKIIFLLIPMLISSFLFGGCFQKEEPEDMGSEQPDESFVGEVVEVEAVLEDWNGNWNALITYLDNEELAGSLDVDDSWKQEQQTDLISFRFQGTSLTAYSEPQAAEISRFPEGSILFDYTYDCLGMVKDGQGITWYQFETSTQSPYQYLLLTEIDDSVTPFFYIRYGAEGFDSLYAMTDWKPMMVSSAATAEEIEKLIA